MMLKEQTYNTELLLEEIIKQELPPKKSEDSGHGPLIGECIEVQHPTLVGRVHIRWQDIELYEKWLPTLHGITVRKGDRVLILSPVNWIEPLVIGVVDGFALRPEIQRISASSIKLERDESIRVTTPEGEQLLEIYYEDAGPVVRLLKDDVELDLKGNLRLNAKSIELNAKRGELRIKAVDDVVIDGENVKVNCD